VAGRFQFEAKSEYNGKRCSACEIWPLSNWANLHKKKEATGRPRKWWGYSVLRLNRNIVSYFLLRFAYSPRRVGICLISSRKPTYEKRENNFHIYLSFYRCRASRPHLSAKQVLVDNQQRNGLHVLTLRPPLLSNSILRSIYLYLSIGTLPRSIYLYLCLLLSIGKELVDSISHFVHNQQRNGLPARAYAASTYSLYTYT